MQLNYLQLFTAKQERKAAALFDVIGFMKRIAGANNKRGERTTKLYSNEAQGGRTRG